MDILYSIGFILITAYALLTVLGLSLTISQIIFHILWSLIEPPIINTFGSDVSSVLYVIGIITTIILAIVYAKHFVRSYKLKYGHI